MRSSTTEMIVNLFAWLHCAFQVLFAVCGLIYLAWFILVGLFGCTSPTGPTRPNLPEELEGWADAQKVLSHPFYAQEVSNPYAFTPDMCEWDVADALFSCGGTLTAGCTYRTGRGCFIRYTKGYDYVIKHEAGHAILWLAGSKLHECSINGHELTHGCEYPEEEK